MDLEENFKRKITELENQIEDLKENTEARQYDLERNNENKLT